MLFKLCFLYILLLESFIVIMLIAFSLSMYMFCVSFTQLANLLFLQDCVAPGPLLCSLLEAQ